MTGDGMQGHGRSWVSGFCSTCHAVRGTQYYGPPGEISTGTQTQAYPVVA